MTSLVKQYSPECAHKLINVSFVCMHFWVFHMCACLCLRKFVIHPILK